LVAVAKAKSVARAGRLVDPRDLAAAVHLVSVANSDAQRAGRVSPGW
jgi:hypothetical protein